MTTPKSALVALVGLLRALCTDPAYFWIVGGLVILGDTLLTQIIIRFISCQYCALIEEEQPDERTIQTQRLTGRLI